MRSSISEPPWKRKFQSPRLGSVAPGGSCLATPLVRIRRCQRACSLHTNNDAVDEDEDALHPHHHVLRNTTFCDAVQLSQRHLLPQRPSPTRRLLGSSPSTATLSLPSPAEPGRLRTCTGASPSLLLTTPYPGSFIHSFIHQNTLL